VLLASGTVGAQPAHRDLLAAKLQADLERLAGQSSGVVGLAVVDIASGQRFGVNERLVFPQGSAIKIPIVFELFRRAGAGQLRLDDRVAVGAADQVGGSGLLQHFASGGSELSLHDLAVAMVVLSDNTATNLLIDRLGMDAVSESMARLGAPETKLRRKMIRPAESARGAENVSTPREAVDLMVRLARCDLPMPAASCAAVRRILEIPKPGAFRDPVPASVPVAWKPGAVEGVETAWGLVSLPGSPYAMAVMVNYAADDASRTIRELSAAAYRYFAQVARTSPHGVRVPLEHLKPEHPKKEGGRPWPPPDL
jgi:beta-lactamase class A